MAEPNPSPAEAAKTMNSATSTAAKAAEGNPALRAMGLPNFKWRLPSRNWLIFWTVVGTWTGAVIYDRRETKRIQRKWAKLVEGMAEETLPVDTMQRRLTIYLSAPPADGLLSAREHFYDYVKPVLVSAALDWDAVEGRREGDVRAQLAERIRKYRRRAGEPSETREVDDGSDKEFAVAQTRARAGIKEWDGPRGDIIIGRNTWKEYVRGLHEGWLGPLDPPPAPVEQVSAADGASPMAISSDGKVSISGDEKTVTQDVQAGADAPSTEGDSSSAADTSEAQSENGETKSKKKPQPPPFISPASYPDASLSPLTPEEFSADALIPFPHVLGFLKTPVRMYRFLTRRHLADRIGREVAAAVFATSRPFRPGVLSVAGADDGTEVEQDLVLKEEESEWHKSIRERTEGPNGREPVWTDPMVLDERIAQRMRRFELPAELEEKAERIIKELPPWWQVWASEKGREVESQE